MVRQQSRVCPHLGLEDDTATHMNFPSPANRCFNCRPSKCPDLAYQQEHCLRQSSDNCMAYQNNGIASIRTESKAVISFSDVTWRMIMLAVVVLVIIGWFYFSRGVAWETWPGRSFPATFYPISSTGNLMQISQSSTEITVSKTSPAPILAIASTPAFNPTTPITASLLPVETFTALPHLHGFEVTRMPVGSQLALLIHIVEYGETLDMIANKYGTTVLAIMAANYKLTPPVWAQYLIVIPIGIRDAVGLPA